MQFIYILITRRVPQQQFRTALRTPGVVQTASELLIINRKREGLLLWAQTKCSQNTTRSANKIFGALASFNSHSFHMERRYPQPRLEHRRLATSTVIPSLPRRHSRISKEHKQATHVACLCHRSSPGTLNTELRRHPAKTKQVQIATSGMGWILVLRSFSWGLTSPLLSNPKNTKQGF